MNRWVVFFIALSLVFAGLFLADLQGYFNVTQKPIAYLVDTSGTVRRLGNNQLTWDRAQSGTLFGDGDTISTGENPSKAKLVFYAGGELMLDAGAMVVLRGGLDELQLNFVSGQGRVRVAERLQGKVQVARGAPPKSSERDIAKAKLEEAERQAREKAKREAEGVAVGALPGVPRPAELAKPVEVAKEEDSRGIEIESVADSELPVEAPPPVEDLNAAVATATLAPAGAKVPRAVPKPVEKPKDEDDAAPIPGQDAAQSLAGGAGDEPAVARPSEPEAPPPPPKAEDEPEPLVASFAPAIQEQKIRQPEVVLQTGGELISEIKLPPVPEIVFPEQDTTFDLSDGTVPKLVWRLPELSDEEAEKSERPTSYEIILRPASGIGKPRVLKSRETTLSLGRAIKGKYLWSVRSVAKGGTRSPATEPRWIEVKVLSNIERPTVLPVVVE